VDGSERSFSEGQEGQGGRKLCIESVEKEKTQGTTYAFSSDRAKGGEEGNGSPSRCVIARHVARKIHRFCEGKKKIHDAMQPQGNPLPLTWGKNSEVSGRLADTQREILKSRPLMVT